MTRPDFEESRQMAAEACTDIGAEPDRAGVGPRGKGPRPVVLMLIVFAVAPFAWIGIAHFAARFF